MIENINQEIVSSEKAQERIKELVEQSEKGYIDSLHNAVFSTLQINDLVKDYNDEESTEDGKKSFNETKRAVEATLKANKGWMAQYETAIPYFNSLLK